MNSKLLPITVLVLASLVFSAGVGFVIMYVWNGVIAKLGDPDQSLLFWYLPVLFMGIFCVTGGWTMGTWGWQRLKAPGSPDS